MLKCEISDIRGFRDLVNVTDKIVDEIRFTCDGEGLRYSALDRGHISFISANLDKSFFYTYLCDEPETLTVDSGELLNVLKRGKSDDILSLSHDEGNLILVFDGKAKRRFRIRLIDAEYDNPTPPSIDFPVNVEVGFKDWYESLKDVELYTDKVTIRGRDDQLFICGEGDKGSYEASLQVLDGLVDGAYESTFSLDHVKKLSSVSGSDLCLCFG